MTVRAPELVGVEPVGFDNYAPPPAPAEPAGPWWTRMGAELRRRFADGGRAQAETAASRSYRHLARRIVSDFPPVEGGRRIVIGSAGSAGLCTEAVLMIAYYLRDELGCRVLLVDDPKRGDTVGGRLGFDRDRGLLDVVRENDNQSGDLTLPTQRPGISILPKGLADADELAPFQLRRIPLLLQAATRRFDYVLVQQTAILDDRSHRFFTAGADLLLVLVEEGDTSMEELELYRQSMTEARARDVRLVVCSRA